MKVYIFHSLTVVILLASVSGQFCSSSVEAAPGVKSSDNRVFSVHDQNRDGFLNQKEYEHFYKQMTQLRQLRGRSHRHMPLYLFGEIDHNEDGLIDEEEMISAMNERLRKHRRYRYRRGR